jgi:hypothetical protein
MKQVPYQFNIFYIDYENQEEVTYSQLRPLDPSVSAAPGLAQLCSLAYIKIPNLEEDFGQEAAEYLSELTLSSGKEFRVMVEERDTTGGKVKGQGTGAIIAVTLVVVDAEIIVNAVMLQVIIAVDSFEMLSKYFFNKQIPTITKHPFEYICFIVEKFSGRTC